MKIISLVPVGYQETFSLELCLHSLKNLSDEIIVLFDGKVSENDISYKIAKKFTNKIFMNKENVYNFNSSKLRNKLLRLGRVHEGTHFILSLIQNSEPTRQYS